MAELNMPSKVSAPLVICLLFLFAGAAAAQENVSNKTLHVEDGWQIKVTYYPSKAGKESPVVILLHGEKQSRKFWDLWKEGWPVKLQQQGIACVTVDLRKHGESNPEGTGDVRLTSRDYQAMVLGDMEEVKRFVFKEHQAERLNMRKLGIIAVDASVPVALNFAANDWAKKPWADAPTLAARTPRGQDVRAMVLVSPLDRVPGLNNGRAVNALRTPTLGFATLVIYSDKDPLDEGIGKALFEKFEETDSETAPRSYELPYSGKAHGFDLIVGNEQAERAMLAFMTKHLKELDDEWVNRKSPVDTSIDE